MSEPAPVPDPDQALSLDERFRGIFGDPEVSDRPMKLRPGALDSKVTRPVSLYDD